MVFTDEQKKNVLELLRQLRLLTFRINPNEEKFPNLQTDISALRLIEQNVLRLKSIIDSAPQIFTSISFAEETTKAIKGFQDAIQAFQPVPNFPKGRTDNSQNPAMVPIEVSFKNLEDELRKENPNSVCPEPKPEPEAFLPSKNKWLVFDAQGNALLWTISGLRITAIEIYNEAIGTDAFVEKQKKGFRVEKVNIHFKKPAKK